MKRLLFKIHEEKFYTFCHYAPSSLRLNMTRKRHVKLLRHMHYERYESRKNEHLILQHTQKKLLLPISILLSNIHSTEIIILQET
jgi:hypothetical protein